MSTNIFGAKAVSSLLYSAGEPFTRLDTVSGNCSSVYPPKHESGEMNHTWGYVDASLFEGNARSGIGSRNPRPPDRMPKHYDGALDLCRPLGFTLDGGLTVQSVVAGGQAEALGCAVGWRVVKLGCQYVRTLAEFKSHRNRVRSAAGTQDRMVPCAVVFRTAGIRPGQRGGADDSAVGADSAAADPLRDIRGTSSYSSIRNAPAARETRKRHEVQWAGNFKSADPRSLPPAVGSDGRGQYVLGKPTPTPTPSPLPPAPPPPPPEAGAEAVAATAGLEGDADAAPVVAGETSSSMQSRLEASIAKFEVVSEPLPPPIQPELNSLGETASLVRGSVEWQKSRAPIRRGPSKPAQLIEVKVPKVGGEEGGKEWVAAVFEKDLGDAGRKYTILEDPVATNDDDEDEDQEDDDDNGGDRGGDNDENRRASTQAPRSVVFAHEDISSHVRPLGAAPRCRVKCFLCGKEVGLKSLHFHFQKCLLKWDRRVALPQRHAMEMFDPRSLPSGPGPELDAYNLRAEEIHRDTVMPRCPNCFKTFNSESIISHVNNCCKGRPALIKSVTDRYDPKGYRPLGEKLVGAEFKTNAARRHGGQSLPTDSFVGRKLQRSGDGRRRIQRESVRFFGTAGNRQGGGVPVGASASQPPPPVTVAVFDSSTSAKATASSGQLRSVAAASVAASAAIAHKAGTTGHRFQRARRKLVWNERDTYRHKPVGFHVSSGPWPAELVASQHRRRWPSSSSTAAPSSSAANAPSSVATIKQEAFRDFVAGVGSTVR